jgi:RIP metalloprotease RseP
MNIWTFLLFIVSLGVLIFIHELGHFTMAKLFNVYVKEFSLGFGPVVFKRKKGETQYSIRALPLGGYVSMYGEETVEVDQTIPKERSLLGIKKYKRALIMSAGILLNFVLAFLLFFVSNVAFEQRNSGATSTSLPGVRRRYRDWYLAARIRPSRSISIWSRSATSRWSSPTPRPPIT